MAGPGYTVRDLMWWTGFIAGTVIVTLSLRPMEVLPQFWCTIVGMAVGVGVGYLLETAYVRSRAPRPLPHEEDAEDFDSYKRDEKY
jgi:uncharacterized membrane protein